MTDPAAPTSSPATEPPPGDGAGDGAVAAAAGIALQAADEPEARPDAKPTGLAQAALRGSVINTLVQVLTAALTQLAQIVLAWFLAPSEFGLVALAGTFTAFVQIIREFGALRILVQRRAEFERLAGTMFWVNASFSALCAVTTAAAAPLVAGFYHEPRLVPVVLVMACQFLVSPIGAVSATKLTIDLRWAALGRATLAGTAIQAVLSVFLARRGWGVYSLLVPAIVADAVRGLLAWYLAGMRREFSFSAALARGVVASTAFIGAQAVTATMRYQGDYVVLGRLAGDTITGLYYYAYGRASLTGRLFVSAVMPVLFPIFATIADDEHRQEMVYRRSLHTAAVFAVLATALQVGLAFPVFRLILPVRWLPAAPLFAILSVSHLVLLMGSVAYQPMQARGEYKRVFIFEAILAPCEVAAFVVGALFGSAKGVAIAGVLANFVGFVAWQVVCSRVLGFGFRESTGQLWRPVIPGALAASAAWAVAHFLGGTKTCDAAALVLGAAAATAVYGAALLLFWRDVLRDVVTTVGSAVRRRLGRGGVRPVAAAV